MATNAGRLPSTRLPALQTVPRAFGDVIERALEAERDQLVLWLPVALGAGIATWFVLPDARSWGAALVAALAVASAAAAAGRGGRIAGAGSIAAATFALGLALVWWRAERVAAPVLARPAVVQLDARVERVQPQPARSLTRLVLAPLRWDVSQPSRRPGRDARAGKPAPPRTAGPMPTRVRVNVAADDLPPGVITGSIVRLRARLMPPATAAVPGAYDFSRAAWFAGIGATGRALGRIAIVSGAGADDGIRRRLSTHIERRLAGSVGGIAAALATGDTGAITAADNEAMRRAGLAHLLSVSGLHITAVVGIVMLAAMRLLALYPPLALTGRVPLLAGAAAAAAAIGYTLLTGAEVPTIRSCVAALMVLAALAIGREAVTLRLVGTGAAIVLLLWPEALVGASFQLSFAAVTVIVALHDHPAARRFALREGGALRRAARQVASLFVTGVAIEVALMPIAIFHFHKAGLYGAVANIVAIPLTTFVVMPAEAGALLFDTVGLGAPLWWLTGAGISLLLGIAHAVAAAPGAVAALPAMPTGAFALIVAGGLWIALWRTPMRWAGLLPVAAGAAWMLATPSPDLLVTGDGRHMALRTDRGGVAILRDRAGDFTRGILAENVGIDGEPGLLSEQDDAACSRDACIAQRESGGRTWRILATRSGYLTPIGDLAAACRTVDIVISDRRLPRSCRPAWLKLDAPVLRRTGGVAVTLSTRRVAMVQAVGDVHPWRAAVVPAAMYRDAYRPAMANRRPVR